MDGTRYRAVEPTDPVAFDLSTAAKLSTGVESLLYRFLETLPAEDFDLIKRGKFALVPPGHAGAAGIALAILHGIAGHFPRVLWTVRGEDGFVLIERPLPLQSVRNAARERRFD